ncbi:MAG TPA: DinB family protein [Vicinamibacterales bacterium]|nr:DinB family protein [Vicinamibacterales bacterium]
MVEAWLRGPIPGVPPVLLPAAHALQHAVEDVERALEGLSTEEIWSRPGGAASVGFHVCHLAGALDRLLTYARGEMLSDVQRAAVKTEGEPGDRPADAAALMEAVRRAVDAALDQIRRTPPESIFEERAVGRQRLPSTVLGLIVHAAEHAARHAGQAITTARIVRGMREGGLAPYGA